MFKTNKGEENDNNSSLEEDEDNTDDEFKADERKGNLQSVSPHCKHNLFASN